MKISGLSKKLTQKRIPTIIGLGILVVALVAGVVFIGSGPGVFAPRATPETTPNQVRITNITDRSFTVSFLTDSATTGFVQYGTEPGSLESQASDNRDQVSGSVGEYTLHYITVRGIQANTQYYFEIGTNSNTFDNNGAPFSITTARRIGAPPAARTISGTVQNPNGGAAEGAVVYISGSNMEDMSSLVSTSGSWAVPLSDARTSSGDYAEISDSSQISIEAVGSDGDLTSTLQTTVAEAHPFPAITLGSSTVESAGARADQANQNDSAENINDRRTSRDSDSTTATDSDNEQDEQADGRSALADETEEVATDSGETKTIVELDKDEENQTVNTSQPTITGKAAPLAPVKITINSEHTIETEVTADQNGDFTVNLSELEEELEPGEHTITYSYTNEAGEEITETRTFTVVDDSNLLAQADTEEDEPFGTSNPVPLESSPTPTPTPTPTATASATPSATPATDSGTATRTAKVSTESSLMKSGSVGTTLALVFGGLFFITSGVWSFWISSQLDRTEKSA